MDKLPMCRICLAENVHMYVVVNKTLHDLYEKLTDNPFVTEDSRPILACFICCAQMKKCYRFHKKCLEAEEQFAKMMNEEYEHKPLINQDHVELFHGFIRTPTSIVDIDQTESVAVKEELPVSESDSEDDVPLIEMKTEVEEQESSKRKRKSKKMYNRESSPISMHSNEELTQCLQDMMDDTVFSDRNDPLCTFIPGVVPERRLSEETVVSVTKGTETISEDELTRIENSSLVPTHEDQYGNEFCESLEAYPRADDGRNHATNVSSKDSMKKTDMRKKRHIHKQHWIDVQRKKLKNEGKSFTNKRGKIIPEKVLGQPCGKTCRYKCTENYNLKQRERIFTNFWDLGDRHRHWEFVIKYTKKINKMRRTTEITKHNREFTFIYYLPSEEMESKRVCKQMFLNTISCSDRIIKTTWKKFDGLTSVEKDNRGKYERSPRVKPYRESSPIQVHSNEELTQCLQDLMDDTTFSDGNDPLSTFIPGVVPKRRLSEETVVSVTKGTETISEDELKRIENSSLVPTHEDQYGNEFCESLEAYPRADDVRNLPTNVSSKDFKKKTNMRKKRLIHKQHWIDVQRKKLKNEGKSFTNKRGKIIPEKVLGQSCGKTCRYKCTENYNLKQRERIFTNFWDLGDRHKHWEFVIKYTKKINKMSRTTAITKHNREFTFIYYLPSEEMESKRVCKQMFLNTISCSDRIIKTAWKKFDGLTSVEKDYRGKYERSPRVKPYRESSPIQVHSNEELTQCLQDMMDDTTFSNGNDPLSTFIPGVVPKRRLSEETVVSVTKGTETISEDELTRIENSSLVPTHEDQYDRESSPIQVHSKEELTQCLQDMMDDTTFSDGNDPLSTFIPGVVPKRRLSEETVVSVTKGTETISEDELTRIENSSLVPTHEDQYGNEFCESLEAYPRVDDVRNLPTNVSSKDFIKKADMRKKRHIHKQHWIDVQRKKLKNEGKSFTNKRGKIIPEKVLGQSCRKTCRYKCTENYDLKQREIIFTNFWDLGDRHKHWEFVIKYTKKINKMRRTTEITKHNREFTFIYYLPSEEMESKRVCKQTFLNTISCSDRIIKTAWKKFDGLASVEKDNRGKYEHKPRKKQCELFT